MSISAEGIYCLAIAAICLDLGLWMWPHRPEISVSQAKWNAFTEQRGISGLLLILGAIAASASFVAPL